VSKAPVVLLWGEDGFLLREAALGILEGIGPREVDASEWRGGETADLSTPSLFGERRALLVTDARSLPEHAMAELASYLEAPAPDAPLVLCAQVGERAKAPAALTKLVQAAGEVKEVKLARKDIPGWLVDRARKGDLALAPEGAVALVETLGEDTAALDQALQQLASAFPGERIGRKQVAEQFSGLGEQRAWDLCDKAFAKDLPGAVRALASMLEAREEGLLILGAIASRLRDLLKVKGLPDRMPPAELAKAAGLRFDWQARRYREQARRFSLDELILLHGLVTEADRTLKSGAGDEVVMPALVAAIAGRDG
jgi:DNA polymerase-3 subunit delta